MIARTVSCLLVNIQSWKMRSNSYHLPSESFLCSRSKIQQTGLWWNRTGGGCKLEIKTVILECLQIYAVTVHNWAGHRVPILWVVLFILRAQPRTIYLLRNYYERRRIDSSGNMGIGRVQFTTAGYPIQVRGSSCLRI